MPKFSCSGAPVIKTSYKTIDGTACEKVEWGKVSYLPVHQMEISAGWCAVTVGTSFNGPCLNEASYPADPPECPENQTYNGEICVDGLPSDDNFCPPGSHKQGNACVPDEAQQQCNDNGDNWNPQDETCYIQCPAGTVTDLLNKTCLPECPVDSPDNGLGQCIFDPLCAQDPPNAVSCPPPPAPEDMICPANYVPVWVPLDGESQANHLLK